MTDYYPGFALSIGQVSVLFKERRYLIDKLQSKNLKENGRSIVLKSAKVLYEGSYLYKYGMVCPIDITFPCKKYNIKHNAYDLLTPESSLITLRIVS